MFASKRFLTSVGELVRLEVNRLCTHVIAFIAAEGLLSTVGAHVYLQVSSKCAGITALVTGEGLFFHCALTCAPSGYQLWCI